MGLSAPSDAHSPPRSGAELRTLRASARAFAAKRSPWLIALGVAALAALRIALGDFGWHDAAAAAAMLVMYPFGEWAIHVYLLHMRPLRIRGRRIDPAAARFHRQHHERPHDLGLVALGPVEVGLLLLAAVPAVTALGAALVWLVGGPVPLGPLVTAALTAYVAIGVYEWTHFLIHTAYRPRSRYYRSIWRSHRLHHFKNEHFWHGVTSHLSDRALGTYPDHRTVTRSETAHALGEDR